MNNGYVLHTDPKWLSFHRANHEGTRVLFTRGPSGGLKRLNTGGLLVFNERRSNPHTARGVGVFLGNEQTTLESAWEMHGQAVGLPTREAYLKANRRFLAKPENKGRVTLLIVDSFRSLEPSVALAELGIESTPFAARGWYLTTGEWIAVRERLGVRDLAEVPSISSLEEQFGSASEEGRRVQRTHLRLERDRGVVARAKAQWADANPDLPCELCKVSFVAVYGEHGRDFIEAHHRVPLHSLAAGQTTRTTVEDLAPVCANCHRMLHANGGLGMDRVRVLIERYKTA